MVQMNDRRGIILAGGAGTRLSPITKYIVKQFAPVYDKPMLYYPLYTMLKIGIREILFISTPDATPVLEKNLGNGSEFGANFQYAVQDSPNGIAQAFIIGREFIGDKQSCLILGDNIFYGTECQNAFSSACADNKNVIFGYPVSDPERYGVVEFDNDGNAISIEEKPHMPRSNYAVPGIYFYENEVLEIAANLKPSTRGEYEITDINAELMRRGKLKVIPLGLGNAYLDTGTFESLNDASQFVRTIQLRTGLKVCDISEFT